MPRWLWRIAQILGAGIAALFLFLCALFLVALGCWSTQFRDSVTLPNGMVLKRRFGFLRGARLRERWTTVPFPPPPSPATHKAWKQTELRVRARTEPPALTTLVRLNGTSSLASSLRRRNRAPLLRRGLEPRMDAGQSLASAMDSCVLEALASMHQAAPHEG